MATLLPPGIEKLTAEQVRAELVAYVHAETTAYSRDSIAWYIKNDAEVAADHAALRRLARVLSHTPTTEPSRDFVRRVRRALPQLRHDGFVTARTEAILARARWTFDERVGFLVAYTKYALRHRPLPFITATLGTAVVIVAVALVPAMTMLDDADRPSFLPMLGGASPNVSHETGEVVRPSPAEPSDPGTDDEGARIEAPAPADIGPLPLPDERFPWGPGVEVDRIDAPRPDRPDRMPDGFVDPRDGGSPGDGRLDGPGVVDGLAPWTRRPPPEGQGVLPWYSARVSADDRAERSAEEVAMIEAGLDYLASVQQPNGSWTTNDVPAEGERAEITPGSSSEPGELADDAVTIELTGLALLALLADGVGTYSTEPEPPARLRSARARRAWREHTLPRFRELRLVVRHGIDFLLANQDAATGRFGGEREPDVIKSHAIATLALIEDSAVGRNYDIAPAIGRAVEFLMAAQNDDGFWGYQPRGQRSSLTPTFWATMALRSADYAQAVPVDVGIDDVLFTRTREYLQSLLMYDPETAGTDGWLVTVAERRSSEFPEGAFRPSTIGMALMELLDLPALVPPEDASATGPRAERRAEELAEIARMLDGMVRFLAGHEPTWSAHEVSVYEVDYYYWYYGSLALANVAPALAADDPRIVSWREGLVALLAERQVEGVGAWPAVHLDGQRGRVHSTALAVLALANPYRYDWLSN